MRWAVSLAVVALVIVASAAVAAIITGRSSTASCSATSRQARPRTRRSASTCPATSAPRPAQFLSKFPGFADQAALDTKLDEVLDQLVKDATNNEQTYTANIKPWFDGELAFSVGPLPPAPAASSDGPPVPRLVPRAGPGLDQGSGAGPGVVRRGDRQDRRQDDIPGLQRRDPDRLRADRRRHRSPWRSIDGKVAAAGDIASVKAAVDIEGIQRLRLRARSEGRARLGRRTTTSASATSRSARCSTGRTT